MIRPSQDIFEVSKQNYSLKSSPLACTKSMQETAEIYRITTHNSDDEQIVRKYLNFNPTVGFRLNKIVAYVLPKNYLQNVQDQEIQIKYRV
jgi:hypothetical protein